MKLLDQVRAKLRLPHYSIRTEKAYVYWIERYIRFHHIKHPNTMGAREVEQFLSHLAVNERVSASTQNQAFGAQLFLHQKVLAIDCPRNGEGCPRSGERGYEAVTVLQNM